MRSVLVRIRNHLNLIMSISLIMRLIMMLLVFQCAKSFDRRVLQASRVRGVCGKWPPRWSRRRPPPSRRAPAQQRPELYLALRTCECPATRTSTLSRRLPARRRPLVEHDCGHPAREFRCWQSPQVGTIRKWSRRFNHALRPRFWPRWVGQTEFSEQKKKTGMQRIAPRFAP